jgi:alkanesulfonate monooxygenase SsuD/methylene tetrahydromethanopterin reductase-like flavin-dependent oxidoreductase (luciferase family)
MSLDPGRASATPPGFLVSPVFHGTPEQVTEAILADEGLQAADELVLFLPSAFGLAENRQLLTDFASTVAPSLGWVPSHPDEKERPQ